MLSLPKTEKSLWRASYPKSLYPKLKQDIEVDVVIVGGGITGLTTAYLLKKSGMTVAVLEKETVGAGTTGRTTGKVTSQHNLIYDDLQERLSRSVAKVYADANQAAVDMIGRIIKNERIKCGWEVEDNYVFTTDLSQTDKFKQEAKVAKSLGLPASFETNTPLPFEVSAAVKFTGQAKINAQAYLLGLAEFINGNGSYVFEHSEVVFFKDNKPCKVKTKAGSITASNIVVATNVPTLPLPARGTYAILEYPQESYIVAGKIQNKLPGMYISPDKKHYSILPVTIGEQNLVLVGGEGHISGLRGSTKRRYRRLANYAEQYLGVSEITHRWSDRDYMAYDDLPVIGRLYPWSKHIYVGTAFRKWGLTNGTVAGMILCDLINGKTNLWSEVFYPHRASAITSIPRVMLKHLLGKS